MSQRIDKEINLTGKMIYLAIALIALTSATFLFSFEYASNIAWLTFWASIAVLAGGLWYIRSQVMQAFVKWEDAYSAQELELEVQYGVVKNLYEKISILEEGSSQTDSNIQSVSVDTHLDIITEKIAHASNIVVKGEMHTKFVSLYAVLRDASLKNNSIPLEKLANVSEDVKRINQMETIIDMYTNKINQAKNDETLDEEMRDTKVSNWERLMERDIARLEAD